MSIATVSYTHLYDGYVSLEFEGMEDVMQAVSIGTRNIQRMIKDLEAK